MSKIFWYEVLESTQEEARRLAEAGEKGVVVARRQTAGRGRRGRPWLSPEGGLYATFILPGEELAFPPELLPLAAGVAVVKALKALYGISLGLKWPNDVLYQGRKLCGLLVESLFREGHPVCFLVGVGINLNRPVPEAPQAVSLGEILGREVPLEEVLSGLMAAFKEVGHLKPEEVLSSWRAFSETLGRRVRILHPEGSLEGIALEVSPYGNLILKTEEGLREVAFGDCIHLRPAG
ncbi:biotin--[acetyl-CoA-carboxylase] ligase [Thermosulfurimonas marina]|uniref:biotin--[biotin carboxyl-carrier protein] ligase n=1 Tax=Thermosulfurimonas marina TaxID=2047767 RepID=A0A6H1WR26_9BACT|nr:biotin--[acetyl-CoA-carboxylase] ligase [Thermosulfurimonas marina]QJA05643.1 biotin--[acetyl-CoA-carboxylase] ligase [Thermosulfurimonas marina]